MDLESCPWLFALLITLFLVGCGFFVHRLISTEQPPPLIRYQKQKNFSLTFLALMAGTMVVGIYAYEMGDRGSWKPSLEMLFGLAFFLSQYLYASRKLKELAKTAPDISR